ncbi:hypothetical protein Tco_1098192, partial [Tanacetum coccineum]
GKQTHPSPSISSKFNLGRRKMLGEMWDCQLGNLTAGKVSGGGGRSYRIDDEVVQDQRQRDDNDLQYERQDQPKEEEVKPKRSKRARIEKLFRPDFVSFMVENEPTSYREAITSSEWLNGMKPLKLK